jgi:predicted phosphodiesterase
MANETEIMNILVLSDLHIDACDHFGTFQWNELDFISKLDVIRSKYSIDKVIFNGDAFELVKYNYKDLQAANPALMRYFSQNDFIFIKGNHDIKNKMAVDHYDILNKNGQKIHIEHGHKADWLNGTRVGRMLGVFGLSFLKILSENSLPMKMYYNKVANHEKLINDFPKKYNTIKYLSYALKLLKVHDVVILGHTHKLEVHHTKYLNRKKRYLNSGTCSLGRFQCIVMDTETLKYELLKFNRAEIILPVEIKNAI